MGKKSAIILVVVLASYACLATLWAGMRSVERRSQEGLLEKLAIAKPTARLPEVAQPTGATNGRMDQTRRCPPLGRVKEKAFCKDKKLFRFYATTPPCRTVDVYTDANDVIVYATWTGL